MNAAKEARTSVKEEEAYLPQGVYKLAEGDFRGRVSYVADLSSQIDRNTQHAGQG